jgi:hypothetical protein
MEVVEDNSGCLLVMALVVEKTGASMVVVSHKAGINCLILVWRKSNPNATTCKTYFVGKVIEDVPQLILIICIINFRQI